MGIGEGPLGLEVSGRVADLATLFHGRHESTDDGKVEGKTCPSNSCQGETNLKGKIPKVLWITVQNIIDKVNI